MHDEGRGNTAHHGQRKGMVEHLSSQRQHRKPKYPDKAVRPENSAIEFKTIRIAADPVVENDFTTLLNEGAKATARFCSSFVELEIVTNDGAVLRIATNHKVLLGY